MDLTQKRKLQSASFTQKWIEKAMVLFKPFTDTPTKKTISENVQTDKQLY